MLSRMCQEFSNFLNEWKVKKVISSTLSYMIWFINFLTFKLKDLFFAQSHLCDIKRIQRNPGTTQIGIVPLIEVWSFKLKISLEEWRIKSLTVYFCIRITIASQNRLGNIFLASVFWKRLWRISSISS